jgi:hypothetical protein
MTPQAAAEPEIPFEIYSVNVERMRRQFPSLYPKLQADILSHRTIVVELM